MQDFLLLIFSPIPLPNLIGSDGGIKVWNPKKGFLNLSLWKRWLLVFSLQEEEEGNQMGLGVDLQFVHLDGQWNLVMIHAPWVNSSL